MLANFFNSSKSRASMEADKSLEQERQNSNPAYSSENQAWNPSTDRITNPDIGLIAMHPAEVSTDFNTSGEKGDLVMNPHSAFEAGGIASPVSANGHEQSPQQNNVNSFKIEQPPIAGQIMSPDMVAALLQATNAAPLDTDDRFLQPSDLMGPVMHHSFHSGDVTMEGMGGLQSPQVNGGPTDHFDIGNDQEFAPLPDLHKASPFDPQSRAGIQKSGSLAEGNAPVSSPSVGEDAAMGNTINPNTPAPASPAQSCLESHHSGVKDHPVQVPCKIYADDSALLVDQQRGRLIKYRPSDKDWPAGNRATSAPPRCVDHYSFVANWPPQEPPTCDFGRRVDVFPPRDAPLHLHIQAYALRWGLWTSTIKDKEIRQQVLDTIGDKMKDAWENAIGENYYVRPLVPLDDSDHRNDTEDKAKKGRKRAVSPTRQPAGFTTEGKDQLAITNGELAEHNLTMDMINKRVQEKDFEAGEEALDEVLESLGRDQLVVRDWSPYGFNGSVRGRNLLMYSLFIVLECRNERRKLKNLMARFTKELQKRNTRARIETCQEREFQHLALAAELQLARQEDAPEESRIDEESEDNDDEMEVDDADAASQVDENVKEDNLSDNESAQESASDEEEASSDDHEMILQVAQAVLAADSDTSLYTAFTQHGMDSTSFAITGVENGDHPSLQSGKAILGELFELATRLISQREMVKREHNPAEVLKMNLDIKLSHEKISQAQNRLTKVLNLAVNETQGPSFNTIETPYAHQGGALKFSPPSSDPQEDSDMSEAHGQNEGTNASSDHLGFEEILNSGFDEIPPAASIPHQYASVPQNITFGGPQSELSNNSHQPQGQHASRNIVGVLPQPELSNNARKPPQGQHVQTVQQQNLSAPQATSPAEAEDVAAKAAYINQMWRPWLDAELEKRGQPPSQGVLTDWPQLRDIIARLGYTATDRNQLLRNFKTQFDQWMKDRQPTQQPAVAAQSPAVSSASPAVQASSANIAPPTWPSAMEVAALVPPAGIHANQLVQKFAHRLGRNYNQFSQLIHQAAYMDQFYMVYPSPGHAAMAKQQPATPQEPASSSPRPPQPAAKQHQIVTLKLPQTKTFSLPPPQDESSFSQDYKSTEVNSSRGFSFRHLPHSTLEQRMGIDDLIAEYMIKTSKMRKKSYYGSYVTFHDPQNPKGPPIAHGFWDHKDQSKPEGSEWFFNGEDVPTEWLPKLGVKANDNTEDGGEQIGQYRDVWNDQQGRYVKFKLAGPTQNQSLDQGASHEQGNNDNNGSGSGQNYNTYPPGYSPYQGTTTAQQPQPQSQPTKPRTPKPTLGRSTYLDGNDDESVDSTNSTATAPRTRTRGAGVKRGVSAVAGAATGRGPRGGKRRKKNSVGDDEDGDYVPGEE